MQVTKPTDCQCHQIFLKFMFMRRRLHREAEVVVPASPPPDLLPAYTQRTVHTSDAPMLYTASQKTTQLWNGIARNYMDRFWRYLAEIFKRI